MRPSSLEIRFFGEDQMASITPKFDFSDISVLVAEHNSYMRQTMRSILRTFNVGTIEEARSPDLSAPAHHSRTAAFVRQNRKLLWPRSPPPGYQRQ
jgi:hypothetical protein